MHPLHRELKKFYVIGANIVRSCFFIKITTAIVNNVAFFVHLCG